MKKKPTPARVETRSVRPVHTDFQTREAGDGSGGGSGGSGSGGGSSEGPLLVTLSGAGTLTADKTFQEIGDAFEAGRSVFVEINDGSDELIRFPLFSITVSAIGCVCSYFSYTENVAKNSSNNPPAGNSSPSDYPIFGRGVG